MAQAYIANARTFTVLEFHDALKHLGVRWELYGLSPIILVVMGTDQQIREVDGIASKFHFRRVLMLADTDTINER